VQAAASTAEPTTATVLPEAEIDNDNDNDLYDDDDLYNDLRGQTIEYSLIDNDSGHLRSRISEEDHPDMATQNRLMLEMLLENQARWKAEQRPAWERMVAQRERMASKWD